MSNLYQPAPENLPGREWDPSVEWCEKQIKHFCRARAEYTRHLAHLKSIKRQTKKRPKLPIYPLVMNIQFLRIGRVSASESKTVLTL